MLKSLQAVTLVNSLLEHAGNEVLLSFSTAISLSQKLTTVFSFTIDRLKLGSKGSVTAIVTYINGQVLIFSGLLARIVFLVLKKDMMKQTWMHPC